MKTIKVVFEMIFLPAELNAMTFEVSITVIISVIALALSAYSIITTKKRNDSTDLKELTSTLSSFTVKLNIIEKAVMGSPTLSEQTLVNTQEIRNHDRRITTLENARKG